MLAASFGNHSANVSKASDTCFSVSLTLVAAMDNGSERIKNFESSKTVGL